METTTPHEGQSIELLADLVLNAGEKVPTVSIDAYNGGIFTPSINGRPVRAVVDLAGLLIPTQRVPILKDHESSEEVGHTESIVNDGAKLYATGIVSGVGPAAVRVVEAGKRRFPWQASVGLNFTMSDTRLVAQGERVAVNGRTIEGPFLLIKQSSLREISAVSLGADGSTSLTVAAKAAEVSHMVEPDQTPEVEQTSAGTATAIVSPQADTLAASASNDVTAEIKALRAARAAEELRISKIEALDGPAELKAQAISEGWVPEKAELAILRASRPKAPAAIVRESLNTPEVLTAAFCQAGNLRDLEKTFDEKTLDAADRQFKGGANLSLQRVLLNAAQANGYVNNYFDKTAGGMHDILRAAFSTRNIAGVLSNVANKFLLSGYNFVEQAWREIATVRSVNDFKTVTSYRLTDNSTFEEVGPEGQIPHGELDEQSYTNRAKTYAKMYGITRQDIINDDLGALTSIPQRIGRGAGLKLNSVFWAAWLDDSAFFSNSNSPDNLAASTLDVSGLTTVETQFDGFTDPQGNVLGTQAAILLVPSALDSAARVLMSSQALVSGNTTAAPANNPHSGKYRVVKSRYLTDTNAWYLLADPMDIPGIEVAFLNGVQTPTVEQSDADFNTLGIQMRGYFDFGVAKQDFRCGVKSNPS